MTPEEERIVRQRQRSRALVLALLLGGFVVLMYAISIIKMTGD
ncbi:hypothetical protein [Sphingomonas baiyangensis]|nr:hypothetical protein [Sphingomonas baiyangensis]